MLDCIRFFTNSIRTKLNKWQNLADPKDWRALLAFLPPRQQVIEAPVAALDTGCSNDSALEANSLFSALSLNGTAFSRRASLSTLSQPGLGEGLPSQTASRVNSPEPGGSSRRNSIFSTGSSVTSSPALAPRREGEELSALVL